MQSPQKKFIDVSVNLAPETPIWPGVSPYKLVQNKIDLGGGEIATSSKLELIPHCGTHIDAPLHFARNGQSIDQVELERLIGPCLVVEHPGEDHVTKADLQAIGFRPTKRLLVKTRNSAKLRARTLDQTFLALMPDALEYAMQSGVELLGVDGLSIGPFGDLTTQTHVVFCGAGGIIIEMLDLLDVEPGEYVLIAMPVKLEGVEAAPARVILVRPDDVGDVFR
jgi:arylformamidase